ncbi:MAG: outer membrane beta-barrel protein [Desulfobacula sp.]|nr:outer membrane beta-barrel protein [Desulfobacula sp.]
MISSLSPKLKTYRYLEKGLEKNRKFYGLWLTGLFVLLTMGITQLPISARTLLQIVPTLTISEEYSDNYFKTASQKQEESITSYALGFSMGFLDINRKVYLNYSPVYKDYKNQNNRDSLQHKVSLDSEFKPAQHTDIAAHLYYDGNSGNYQGDSWQNEASIKGKTQVRKNTHLTYDYDYTNRFEEQFRTGIYKEHALNRARAGLSNIYGRKDFLNLSFLYEFDTYKQPDPDEYKLYEPSGYISYWFSPKTGMDTNFAFRNKDFDDDLNDIKTYSGDVRYLRNYSKNFDGYLKYRHSFSETQTYEHHIFHPSIGFDWDITEDSGIMLGIGALFHEWSNANEDSIDPFIDLNAYKTFDFSKKASFTITGSSGYSDSGEEAASLGYSTYYKAGYLLKYQLLKQVSSNLSGSYQLIEFHESLGARKDTMLTLGAGLSWEVLQWLQLNLNYSFEDYNTDSLGRNDYTDNRVFFSISLYPEKPIRPDIAQSRDSFDTYIYNREK